MEEDLKQYFSFQVTRNITCLFKSYLSLLEGLKLSDSEYQKCRKTILDNGNGAIREINLILEKLDITLKQ